MNTADTLLISAGSSDITPSRPMPLAGYANRRGLSTGINDPLELNAVMFRRAESVACVVSADLLFVTDELKSSVLDRANVPELAPGCLLFAASHTHFAPGVDSSKPLLGEAWPEYVELVTHRAAALIRALYAAPEEPGNVAYGVVPSRHNVNRRRRGWGREGRLQIRRRIIGAPNWNGPVDDRVHIVLVRVADVPRAILWSFACHPVAFHDRGLVSADFRELCATHYGIAWGAICP